MTSEAHTLQLLKLARREDAGAFEELFAAVADRLLGYIRLRLGARLRQRLESIDVLQEVWLQAFKSLDRFEYRGPGTFRRWILRIADYTITGLVDHHQARKRCPSRPVTRLSPSIAELSASQTGPPGRAQACEDERRLAEALEALPSVERRAILCRYFEDLTIAQTAERLDTSPTTTRRILGRAMLRLGRMFEQEGGSQLVLSLIG